MSERLAQESAYLIENSKGKLN